MEQVVASGDVEHDLRRALQACMRPLVTHYIAERAYRLGKGAKHWRGYRLWTTARSIWSTLPIGRTKYSGNRIQMRHYLLLRPRTT